MGARPVPSKTKGVFRILTGSFDNGPPSFLYTTSRLREIKVLVYEYTSYTFALLRRARVLGVLYAARFRLERPITSVMSV